MVSKLRAKNAVQAILEEDDSYSEWLVHRLVNNLVKSVQRNTKLAYEIASGFENNFRDVMELAEMEFPATQKKDAKGNPISQYPTGSLRGKVSQVDWDSIVTFAEAQVKFDNPPKNTFAKNVKKLATRLNLSDLEVECLVYINSISAADPSFFNFITDLLKSSPERFPAFIALGLDRDSEYKEITKIISPSGKLTEYGLLDYDEGVNNGFAFPIIDPRIKELLLESEFDEASLVEEIVGTPVKATLTIEKNFQHLDAQARKIVKVMKTAAEKGIKGVNVVLYGPAGSGKTELAKAICKAAGLSAYAIGEDIDSNTTYGDDGGKIDSSKRLMRLRQAQAFLSDTNDSACLMDEMEDVLVKGEDSSNAADTGSKILLNRALEENTVPTIWLANDIVKFHGSVKQRFKFPLCVGYQPTLISKDIWAHHIKKNKLKLGRGASLKLARMFDAPPRVIAQSCEAAMLLDGGIDDIIEQVQEKSSVEFGGFRTGYNSSNPVPAQYNPNYLSSSLDLPTLETIFTDASDDQRSVSILIEGESKVGKSTVANYLAERTMRHVSAEDMEVMIMPTQQTDPVHHVSIAFANAAKMDSILVIKNFDKLFSDAHDNDRKKMIECFMDEIEVHKAPVILIQKDGSQMSENFRAFMDIQLKLGRIDGKQLESAYKKYTGSKPPKGGPPRAIGDIKRAGQSFNIHFLGQKPEEIIGSRIAASAQQSSGSAKLGFGDK